MLILSAVNFAKRGDSRREFWISDAIRKQLNNPADETSFNKIASISDTENFLNKTFKGFVKRMKKHNSEQIDFGNLMIRKLATTNCGTDGYYSDYKTYPSMLYLLNPNR